MATFFYVHLYTEYLIIYYGKSNKFGIEKEKQSSNPIIHSNTYILST